MAHEDRFPIDVRIDRGFDGADDVGHVDAGVRGGRAANQRQEAAARESEQRQHRAIAGAINDAGPQDDPVQTVEPRDRTLRLELAAAVRRERRRRVVFGSRRGGSREARHVNEPGAGAARGFGNGACAGDIHRPVIVLMDCRNDAGEMNHGLHVAKRIHQRDRVERRGHDHHFGMQRVTAKRYCGRSNDRVHLEPTRSELRAEMATDEPGCAGHGHEARHGASVFS